jgi:aspartate aminotransferase
MTAEELSAAITDKTVAVILNNPNNPTGSVYGKDEIFALAKVIEKTDISVISDEIYEKLNYTSAPVVSIASYSDKLKAQTVIINGVSKSSAMTGWRIGFSASPLPLAKAMGSMQSHTTSNPCAVSQYAAIAAYDLDKSKQFISEMHASFARRNKLICENLNKIEGLSCVAPDGAFYVFVDVSGLLGKSYNGEVISTPLAFAKKLLAEKLVAVIPCESFGSDTFVRLTYAVSDEDIVKGITRIKEFVSELK